MSAAVVMMLLLFVFAGAVIYYFLTRPEEGEECEGKDDNGVYEIDDKGKCVLKSCNVGWYKSGKECLVNLSGSDCVPTGTPEPLGTYLTNQTGGCELKSCKSPYIVSGDKCALPVGTEILEDGKPYAYTAGTRYVCTSGKDVGCLNRNESAGIAAAAGMYDSTKQTCEGGDYVYCVNPKTVTYAQYAENPVVKTEAGWQNNNHRLTAGGARCNKPENASCQDDQSIRSYSEWGGGNTAKITTGVKSRQCVDGAFLYCPDNAL